MLLKISEKQFKLTLKEVLIKNQQMAYKKAELNIFSLYYIVTTKKLINFLPYTQNFVINSKITLKSSITHFGSSLKAILQENNRFITYILIVLHYCNMISILIIVNIIIHIKASCQRITNTLLHATRPMANG